MGVAAKGIDHPYITTDKKIRNGEPIISGTGIRVLDIAIRYQLMGMSPEEIINAHPHIDLAQVHDALSYYYENKNLIDKMWKDELDEIEKLESSHTSVLEKKLGKIKNLYR
ncbi:MAG TPA: DUF433 domain-containing protein [Syntrophorhabdaceae bacterium]|jgi:uncharacterized protein (DUF433 family)|nr:DUF433 domain-containing protein [Syntrophorhabdaceae bacterium]HQM77146.1 DUF433 domain-containing protein [Syntrophorhabdaceae bacterium]